LFQTLKVALRALQRNKLRSFLTTLGMMIGVGAVISMVAIGEGAAAKVEAQFAAMGSNLLILTPGSTQTSGARGGAGTQATLTWDDLKAIRDELSSVKAAAPVLRISANVMSDEQNWYTQVQGTSPEYLEVRNWNLSSGVPFTQADLDGRTKVCLLGKTVLDKLFPDEDPVGQTVRIRSMPFQVIGVLDSKGQSSFGQDYDDVILVPATTLQSKLQGGIKTVLNGAVMISARSAETVKRAQKEITSLLRDRHHIQPGGEDDFMINDLTELANARQSEKSTMLAMLAGVALVSLLVGGIGIMNIMLVSVTERTKEIGLRCAIGAKPGQILTQFLVEALTLSVIGGLIGVGLGVIAASFIAAKIDWPLLIRADAALVALGFSAFVGLSFGIYPAYRASRLDPIEALRHE
jgi:putative ABC transport system permease protein